MSRLLQAEEEEYTEEEDFYNDGSIHLGSNYNKPHILNDLQNNEKAAIGETVQENSKLPSNLVFSININQTPGETNQSSHTFTSCSHAIGINKTESLISDELMNKIRRIEKRRHLWSADNVRKESSPMISARLNLEKCTPTIDEGSVVNCIDTAFAKK